MGRPLRYVVKWKKGDHNAENSPIFAEDATSVKTGVREHM